MAPTSERVICMIGDSTDGEDYELEEEENDFVEKKINRACSGKKYIPGFTGDPGDVRWVNEIGPKTFNYTTSWKLKVIAKYLLECPKIRKEYKEIKSKFIPPDIKEKCFELDKIFGRGGSVIFAKHFNLGEEGQGNELCFQKFYEVNKKIIDEFLIKEEVKNFNKLSASEKTEYYLKQKAPAASVDTDRKRWLDKFFIQIFIKPKELHAYSTYRKLTEYLRDNKLPDASNFLARVKADLKLDKKQVKFYLSLKKAESWLKKRKEEAKVPGVNTHNTILRIFSNGRFKHLKNYTEIILKLQEKLIDFITRNIIDETKIKRFIKLAMRGIKDESIIINKDFKKEALPVLANGFIVFVFCIGFKRNHAALITAAMFFDLLDSGRYSIKDMSKKLPMAMKRSAKASAIIDEIMGRPSRYDYCGAHRHLPNLDVMKLSQIENEIVQDWLKLKTGKDESQGFIEEVKADLFNDLFKDWYGLELPQLRTGTIKLEPWGREMNCR